MKLWLYALGMCQSMFCAIPCPFHGWEEKARDRMLLVLPFIGLEIGLMWWGVTALCRWLNLPPMLTALAGGMFPYLATGFLHLDGFLDVTDAVGSCRSLEKRREILKDSHVGAFGVIGCGVLLLSQFAASSSFPEKIGILTLVPVVSRGCSALAVTALPPMTTSQYAGRKTGSGRIVYLGILLTVTVAAGFLLFGKQGFALLAEMAAYAMALRHAYRALEGMNGDISGYALTLAELAAAITLAII